VNEEVLQADGAATAAETAVPPRVHSGQRSLGFGKRGLCGHRELATDLAVCGVVRSAVRLDDLDRPSSDVLQLLTAELAIFLETRSQGSEMDGIEAVVVYRRDLLGHDWSSSAVVNA